MTAKLGDAELLAKQLSRELTEIARPYTQGEFVDVEQLAKEFAPKLRVHTRQIRPFVATVDTSPDHERISLRPMSEHHRRHVLAHEFAHILLAHLPERAATLSRLDWHSTEYLVDLVADQLLVPLEVTEGLANAIGEADFPARFLRVISRARLSEKILARSIVRFDPSLGISFSRVTKQLQPDLFGTGERRFELKWSLFYSGDKRRSAYQEMGGTAHIRDIARLPPDTDNASLIDHLLTMKRATDYLVSTFPLPARDHDIRLIVFRREAP